MIFTSFTGKALDSEMILSQVDRVYMALIIAIIFQYRDDWKYVAMIIDRLLLYVFFGITVGGTCGILFSAPSVFQGKLETFSQFCFSATVHINFSVVDQREVLDKLINLYKTGGSHD
ncbi:unnamed protein product [Strongylus vulgaris]|uniref:Uncharacterized protein n=1 Tax=Strongylus vulgaris TaxID=40348 RepID=A0A3P7JDY3_STRVU|nr:unnamed protein product [Strongylus vulgaris]